MSPTDAMAYERESEPVDSAKRMQRVVVLGVGGAGKSTLARRLGEILSLPVHHLDRYFWQPGWRPLAPDAWLATLEDLVAGEHWIIDGNYRRTIPLRLARADTAVFLDPPRRVALRRILRRAVMYRRRPRPDMADGCPEPWLDLEFMGYIWRYHRDVRPETLALLDAFATEPGRGIVHLRSDREVERWLAEIARMAGREARR
jgi:adenylate kinase family enzyme